MNSRDKLTVSCINGGVASSSVKSARWSSIYSHITEFVKMRKKMGKWSSSCATVGGKNVLLGNVLLTSKCLCASQIVILVKKPTFRA